MVRAWVRSFCLGAFGRPTGSPKILSILGVVTIFATACLVALLAQVSVFGLDDAIKAHSKSVFYRATAAFYPAGRDTETSVVLLDDASITGIDTYPPAFETHSMFLRAILSFGPKAVFIDFGFIDDRGDDTFDDLQATLEEFRARNIDVYMPVNSDADVPIIPQLQALADRGIVKLTSPSVFRDGVGSVTYRLTSEADGRTTFGYDYLLDHRPGLAGTLPLSREFEVIWPLPPSPLNCRPYRTAPCYPPANPLQEIWAAIDLRFGDRGADSLDPYGIRQQYIPYVYARAVTDGDQRDIVEPFVKNKLVIYGSDFRMVNDRFETPFYSFASRGAQVPGSFIHAMAVENLIDLNGSPPIVVSEDNALVMLARVVAFTFTTAVSAAFIWRFNWGASLAVFFGTILMLGYAWVHFWILKVAPATWIGDVLALWGGQAALVAKMHGGLSGLGRRISSVTAKLLRSRSAGNA